jgi:hypothetical protein
MHSPLQIEGPQQIIDDWFVRAALREIIACISECLFSEKTATPLLEYLTENKVGFLGFCNFLVQKISQTDSYLMILSLLVFTLARPLSTTKKET